VPEGSARLIFNSYQAVFILSVSVNAGIGIRVKSKHLNTSLAIPIFHHLIVSSNPHEKILACNTRPVVVVL